MSNVQQSIEVDFNIRSLVSDSAGLVFNVDTTLSGTSLSLLYNAKAMVSQSSAIKFNLLNLLSPAKLLSLSFNLLQSLSNAIAPSFSVRTTVAPTSVSTPFNVLSSVQNSSFVEYNVASPHTSVSNSLGVVFHTMINPGSTTHINTVEMNPDTVPPQYITTPWSTSLLGG